MIVIIIKTLSDEPFLDHLKGRHCFQCLLMPASSAGTFLSLAFFNIFVQF